MDRLLPLIVVVPLLGAALLAGAGRWMPRPVAETLGCLCAAASAGLAAAALAGGPHIVWAGDWRPAGGHGVGIVLTGDRTGTGLAALTSLLVVTVLAYAWRYFDEPPRGHTGSFPALILLFQAGMCGFALTGDLFNAFVFFELMGAVGYALTGYRVEEARPVQGALAFGFVNSLGAYATLLGIALLYARTGELGMAQAGRELDALGRHDALVLASFVLILTGLLVKAAAVPFHFWLPDAHAVAPTPVCMLLSGVMVEMGVYGAARVYVTVFAGPGGVPAEDFRRALTVLGLLTALTGATLCWQQRHLKRLLAFSTVAHTGLFLAGLAALEPDGVTGVFLYVLGHAGVKAALFACTGALLDRYGGVDEHRLHGRAREMRGVGALYAAGGLALAGLPPFGTALGKALAEGQAVWLTALYVVVSAVTGGAVLRAAARVFLGAGPREEDECGAPETTGDQELPETARRVRRLPSLMAAVAALLLTGALAVGTVPALAREAAGAARAFTDHAGYAATVLDGTHARLGAGHPYAWWSPAGVGLGLLSALLATGLAALGVRGAVPARRWAAPLRRLHSGHVGDYVAWAVAGIGLLSALILWPGG
ncbi:complex I subunit 5 family protein [Streptomyces sp. CA-181903]|uniref:complex I subunit 5 family protein n=1 Tax=Streptomyces sp. CA-181903 TaxID=3240055 RepID=UPI003D8C0F3D